MQIESLSFVRDAQTPIAHDPGVVLSIAAGPDAQRVVVRGACKIGRGEASLQGVDLPHAIFLTGIDVLEQRPYTIPLVGQRLVFPEDVTLLGDDYLVEFRAVVDARRTMVGPYFLHASFFQHVSNVVRVPFEREEIR